VDVCCLVNLGVGLLVLLSFIDNTFSTEISIDRSGSVYSFPSRFCCCVWYGSTITEHAWVRGHQGEDHQIQDTIFGEESKGGRSTPAS
jgi:hypothetical protein